MRCIYFCFAFYFIQNGEFVFSSASGKHSRFTIYTFYDDAWFFDWFCRAYLVWFWCAFWVHFIFISTLLTQCNFFFLTFPFCIFFYPKFPVLDYIFNLGKSGKFGIENDAKGK